MSRLFLLLLSSNLREQNKEKEHGAGLFGISPSLIFLLKEEDKKIPDPQALSSSKVHTNAISLDRQ